MTKLPVGLKCAVLISLMSEHIKQSTDYTFKKYLSIAPCRQCGAVLPPGRSSVRTLYLSIHEAKLDGFVLLMFMAEIEMGS